MNGWPEFDPSRWRYGPPSPPRPEPLRQPGGRPLPWSYYQRVANKIGVPESFWDWIGRGWPTSPGWQSRMEQARPMVDLETPHGGYYLGGTQPAGIFSRVPFGAPGTYRHELGHHMDAPTGGAFAPPPAPFAAISQTPEWQQAVSRWRGDPQYPASGERVWDYLTGGHPAGSVEAPAWHEAYALAADMPPKQVPRYIQEFYPWRDWPEMEETERRRQMQLVAAGNVSREAAEYAAARGMEPYATEAREAREEVVVQSALGAGIDESDFERMWRGDYQRQPIPSMVFAFTHDQMGSPEEARAAWDMIPPADRNKALRWFFEGVWPVVKDDPEDWQDVKDFLDYIGIEGWGIVEQTQARPMTNGQLNELYDRLEKQQRARRRK